MERTKEKRKKAMENKGIKKSFFKVKFRILTFFAAMYGFVMASPVVAFAKDKEKGVSEVTSGIDVLKDLVLACVSGVGVIFLAWGLLDFGTAYSAHDTTQQSSAIKKVVGGLIMIAVPTILTLLGAT